MAAVWGLVAIGHLASLARVVPSIVVAMLIGSKSTLPSRMACYGANGTGTQLALDLRYQAGDAIEFVGYVDDFHDERRRPESGYPIMTFDELLELDDVGVFVPVFDPVGRRALHSKLRDHGIPILGSRGLPHLVHPAAEVGEGALITCTARLGHDVEIGDFTTFGYGSVVLGHVQIGRDVFVGTGAVIQNGTVDRALTIGDGAVIGAGAVVTHDVAPGQVMVGPRAMPLDEWRALLGSRRDLGDRPEE